MDTYALLPQHLLWLECQTCLTAPPTLILIVVALYGRLKTVRPKHSCTAEVPVNDENPTGGSLGPRKELEDNLDRAGGHSVLKHLSRCLSQQGLILSMGII